MGLLFNPHSIRSPAAINARLVYRLEWKGERAHFIVETVIILGFLSLHQFRVSINVHVWLLVPRFSQPSQKGNTSWSLKRQNVLQVTLPDSESCSFISCDLLRVSLGGGQVLDPLRNKLCAHILLLSFNSFMSSFMLMFTMEINYYPTKH